MKVLSLAALGLFAMCAAGSALAQGGVSLYGRIDTQRQDLLSESQL